MPTASIEEERRPVRRQGNPGEHGALLCRYWPPLPGEAQRGGVRDTVTSVCRTPYEWLSKNPKSPLCSLIRPYFVAHVTANLRRDATEVACRRPVDPISPPLPLYKPV